MNVRAKFKCQSVTDHAGGMRIAKLTAVCADEVPENQRYHRYTPSGSIEISIDNPSAAAEFVPGKSYYLDFTLAD